MFSGRARTSVNNPLQDSLCTNYLYRFGARLLSRQIQNSAAPVTGARVSEEARAPMSFHAASLLARSPCRAFSLKSVRHDDERNAFARMVLPQMQVFQWGGQRVAEGVPFVRYT